MYIENCKNSAFVQMSSLPETLMVPIVNILNFTLIVSVVKGDSK